VMLFYIFCTEIALFLLKMTRKGRNLFEFLYFNLLILYFNYVHFVVCFIINRQLLHSRNKIIFLLILSMFNDWAIYMDLTIYRPSYIYRVSQQERAKLREGVPYVKLYRYNPKHLYPKLNGYGDNGKRSLKLWQLLHTYWLPNSYWNWQEYVVSVMLISVLNIKVTCEWHKAIKLNYKTLAFISRVS